MANVLGTLFGDIAKAIREKTGDTAKMKPAEFPEKISAIEGSSGETDYYRGLAEMVMTRDTKYFSDDKTKLVMKNFVMSDGATLGNIQDYVFAGFETVESMLFNGVVLVGKNAFTGDTRLKTLDFTLHSNVSAFAIQAGAFYGCPSLESLIIRDGGMGVKSAFVSSGNGANDTFYVYVPARNYEQIISELNSDGCIPPDRYRKLEEYPLVDKWNETRTVNFYDGDTLVDTVTVNYGKAATTTYSKTGYTLVGWMPDPSCVTEDMNCYGEWVPKSFATSTWAEIKAAADSGNIADFYSVGDSKPVTLTYSDGTSETINFTIVDMGVDVGEDESNAAITLMANNLVKTSLKPASAYNKGAPHFYTMDNASAFFETLYNALPSDLQAVIKPVYKRKVNSTYGCLQKVFTVSQYNIAGTSTTNSNATSWAGYCYPQIRYKHFSNGATILRSKLTDSTADSYWTSTPRSVSSASYYTVLWNIVDGSAVAGSAVGSNSAEHGIVPCFCI